jgi:hypothetical protein
MARARVENCLSPLVLSTFEEFFMFKICAAPVFEFPVKLTVPGQSSPGEITVTFRHKSQSELSAWLASARDGRGDLSALVEVVEGWDGVEDQEGKVIAYTSESLGVLIDQYHPAAGELFNGYLKGLTESRVKN